MNYKLIFGTRKGFAVIGVVVAISVLASMAAGLAFLTASNQSGRLSNLYSQQSYYVSHASFEYALNRIKVKGDTTISPRQIMGSELGITRASSKISSSTSYGASGMLANASFSVTDPGSGSACIYVLASSGSGAMSVTGSANLSSTSCGIDINSSSTSALSVVGSASINTNFLNIVGGYSKTGSGTITTTSGSINTGTTAVADPLLAYTMPTYAACDYTGKSITGSTVATLTPGVYCNGISITGSPTVTFQAGNYILDGGTFSITGSPSITANNVTFFLNKQLKAAYTTISIAGSPSFTLTAPTTGTYAGIAFFQSRSAPSASNSITGSAALNITGAIYLPNQTLSFTGSSSSTAPCTMIVVNNLTVTGSPNISCPSGSLGGLIH